MTRTAAETHLPVCLRGRALSCALGDDLDRILAAVRAGRVHTVSLPFTLTEPGIHRPYYLMPGTDVDATDGPEGRFYDPLCATVARALKDAGLTPAETADMGVFLGSTSMDIPIYEARYAPTEARDYFTQSASGLGLIVDRVADRFNIGGPCCTFTTACTSSANGILHAARLIRQGVLSRALVIGYDRFNKIGFYGFESLKLLSPSRYRPFDKHRDGIIMGEACAAVVLDAKVPSDGCWRVVGGANTCDTYNVALHNTDGSSVARVMKNALAAAGLGGEDILGIKAHATGSVHNDMTEALAVLSVFGGDHPPVTGLKPYVGHTVGASGVTELVLFTEAVNRGFLPATPGFEVPDDALGLAPLTENRPAAPGRYMLNYFGFGGNCTTLIVAREP